MLRLELDGDAFDLTATGAVVTEVDPGWPDVRTVVEDRQSSSGTRDATVHHGARILSIKATVPHDARRHVLDGLGRFLAPGSRPTVVWDDDDGQLRQATCAADKFSQPLVAGPRDLTLSWRVPSGLIEGVELMDRATPPQFPPAGRTYPLTFDRTYPHTEITAIDAVNEGNAFAPWSATIIGPIVGPAIVNLDTDQAVVLSGLTLATGEWVVVDSAEHTVYASGDPGSSRFGTVDVTSTNWWRLAPGTTRVQLQCTDAEGWASMALRWRDAYLT